MQPFTILLTLALASMSAAAALPQREHYCDMRYCTGECERLGMKPRLYFYCNSTSYITTQISFSQHPLSESRETPSRITNTHCPPSPRSKTKSYTAPQPFHQHKQEPPGQNGPVFIPKELANYLIPTTFKQFPLVQSLNSCFSLLEYLINLATLPIVRNVVILGGEYLIDYAPQYGERSNPWYQVKRILSGRHFHADRQPYAAADPAELPPVDLPAFA
ncbi:hypothetical protein HYFRA_00012549 [Hymenoscyphus fraxineus]|uniref:Uncharacterized protein n=1 Tax=Hymenoscyphus fraxineus TaxID=746836 RepID=A0A9N9L803_9HELO|nr:hypothetical protein HYFRA_00012549 [Hymenoscyphus fraxineus]